MLIVHLEEMKIGNHIFSFFSLFKADLTTRRSAYTVLFKICKLMLTTAGYSMVHMVAEACQPESTISVSPSTHKQAVVLQQAMHQIPSPVMESVVRTYAQRLATNLLEQGAYPLPDQAVITAIIRLAWASAGGSLSLVNGSADEMHDKYGFEKSICIFFICHISSLCIFLG